MGFISHCSAERPWSPVRLNLSPSPPPGSAFWPPCLYSRCACHPPTCSASSPSRPPCPRQHSPCPTCSGEVLLSACLESSLLGLDKDEKQRPILTEARSRRKEGRRLPNIFWTTKGAVTPESRAKGEGSKPASVTLSLGHVLSCSPGKSQRFHQNASRGCSPPGPPPPQCPEPVFLRGYLRKKYGPEFWKGQEEKGD